MSTPQTQDSTAVSTPTPTNPSNDAPTITDIDLQKALRDFCLANKVSMTEIEKLLSTNRSVFDFELTETAGSNSPTAVDSGSVATSAEEEKEEKKPEEGEKKDEEKEKEEKKEDQEDEELRVGEEDREGANGTKYTKVHQVWNFDLRSWVPRDPKGKASKEYSDREGIVFVVKEKTFSNSDKEPMYEFDIKSPHLVDFIKDHVKKVESMYGQNPSIDGKSLFLAHSKLKEHIAEKKKRLEVLEKEKAKKEAEEKEKAEKEAEEKEKTEKEVEEKEKVTEEKEKVTEEKEKTEEEVAEEKEKVEKAELEKKEEVVEEKVEKDEASIEKEATPKVEEKKVKFHQSTKEEPEKEKCDCHDHDAPIDYDTLSVQVKEIETLLDYIWDEAFLDTRTKLEKMPEGEISWSLLWTLFRPGTLCLTSDPVFAHPMAFELLEVDYTEKQGQKYFVLAGEYIEFTGNKFMRIPTQRSISQYNDIKKVTKLPVTMLEESMKNHLQERGKKYVDFAGVYHREYEGNISTIGIKGKPVLIRASGRAMIDVKSFRKMNPTIEIFSNLEASNSSGVDEYGFSCTCCTPKKTSQLMRNAQMVSGDREDEKEEIPPLDEKEWFLTPCYVYGFSLKNKVWGEMIIDGFKDIKFQEEAFEHLVLDEKYKKIIKALITAPRGDGKQMLQDVIQGKSGGICILLEGSPGVGKTLTAEGCAELLHRPLYSVTSGSMGFDATSCENVLRDIFDVAKEWNALVLLDEADVFLEQRSSHDLVRNALVSTFLQMLEYQDTILFMTTNRVGSFDPAFFSRFSIALKYPTLEYQHRLAIWEKFIQRINQEKVFTKPVLEKLARKELNGRLIKRCLQTAQAVALSESVPLSPPHVEAVIDILMSFQENLEKEGVELTKTTGSHTALYS